MSTVLQIYGWHFFFTEKDQVPVQVTCKKEKTEARYLLDDEIFDVINVDIKDIDSTDNRLLRKIIFNHFDYLVEEWKSAWTHPLIPPAVLTQMLAEGEADIAAGRTMPFDQFMEEFKRARNIPD